MESSQPHDSNAVRVDACRRHSPVVEPCKWHFCQSAGEIDWVSPSQLHKKSLDLGLRYYYLYMRLIHMTPYNSVGHGACTDPNQFQNSRTS